jgi:hypothetical protein
MTGIVVSMGLLAAAVALAAVGLVVSAGDGAFGMPLGMRAAAGPRARLPRWMAPARRRPSPPSSQLSKQAGWHVVGLVSRG